MNWPHAKLGDTTVEASPSLGILAGDLVSGDHVSQGTTVISVEGSTVLLSHPIMGNANLTFTHPA